MNVVVPDNAQHIGARTSQEDSFGFSIFDDEQVIQNRGSLAVIADGMGGMKLGREASQAAVSKFLDVYQNLEIEKPIPNLLFDSLTAANQEVREIALENKLENEIGTTLIAATIVQDNLFWISVGDSRIYLYREGELTQLTEDHIYSKLLQEEVTKGLLSKEEALNHPQKDGLISFLGLSELPVIDYNIKPFPLQPNDRILLCSDGLYGFLSEPEIVDILSRQPIGGSQSLVDSVIEKNNYHQDNVTVAVLSLIGEHVPKEQYVSQQEEKAIVTQKEEQEIKTSRKRLAILLSVFITLLICSGMYFGYEYIMKDADWNPFHSEQPKDDNPTKVGEEKGENN